MRKVLITGGSRGIGRACVEKFISEGDCVAFVYRTSDADAKELAQRTGANLIKSDVSSPEGAKMPPKKLWSFFAA